jgi:hypothetical protein
MCKYKTYTRSAEKETILERGALSPEQRSKETLRGFRFILSKYLRESLCFFFRLVCSGAHIKKNDAGERSAEIVTFTFFIYETSFCPIISRYYLYKHTDSKEKKKREREHIMRESLRFYFLLLWLRGEGRYINKYTFHCSHTLSAQVIKPMMRAPYYACLLLNISNFNSALVWQIISSDFAT